MNFFPTSILEVIRVEPRVFGDARGFYMETYRADQMAAAGIPAHFVQDNHSGSHRNILRGLHYQIRRTVPPIAFLTSIEFERSRMRDRSLVNIFRR